MNKKIQLFYFFILFAHLTFAKDIYVSAGGDNGNDGTSLENAVADLNAAFLLTSHDDVIIVDGTAGVIYHPSAFGVSKRLNIKGQNNAIIDAKLADGTINNKIFNYTHTGDGTYLTVENITFKNGNGYFGTGYQQGGGFLVKTTGILTFKDCVFEGHTSTKHGGVFSIQQGTVVFESCVFNNNTLASSNGGVIYAESDLPVDITLSECLFTNNVVGNHGGVFNLLFKDHATDTNAKSFKVINSTFYNNSCTKSGGVLNDISTGAATIELENITISDNKTDGNSGNSGGLMLNSTTSTYLIENSIIYGNKSFANGEVISDLSMNDAAKITIKSSIFGAIIKNDLAIIEDTDNVNTSIDDSSIYGTVESATNDNIPVLTLTYDAVNGVFTFADDALPVDFADATLLSGSDEHSLLEDQLGKVRKVENNKIDAGAYQLDGSITVDEVLTDNTPPTDPSNIAFSTVTETSFDVSWTAATDAVLFGHYEVQLNDETPISTTELSTSFSDLTLSTEYTVKVTAVDFNGNKSNVVEAKQTTAGMITPVIPTDLAVANVTSVSAVVSWQSTEPSGLTYVVIEGTNEYETSELTYTLEGLIPATEYSITVKSKNENDEISEASTTLTFTTSSYVPKTIYVKAGDDAGNDGLSPEAPVATIISAYNKAEDGDVIEVDGTIVYDTSIGIKKNITIRGVNNATLDAQDALKFFNFDKSEEDSYLNLENITFKGSNGKYNGGNAQVGGAMLLNSPGKVKISGCTFEGNTTSLNGGVIAFQNGELDIIKSVFKNNTISSAEGSTASGSVLHVSSTAKSVKLNIDQSVFRENTSLKHGGVINVETNASGNRFDISIQNSTIYGNQTATAGGVIFLGNTGVGTLDLTNVTITNNSTLANGGNCGGIRSINEDAVVTINNSIIYGNWSNFGQSTQVMSDVSTNDYTNFTVNHSIIGALVSSNTLSGVEYVNGTVSGSTASDVPELTLEAINDDNVVAFASDAIAANFGSASYLSAAPANGTFLVDQLDNVRKVKEGKIDVGAYQVDAKVNVEDALNDNVVPSDVTNIVFSEVEYSSFVVTWDASTDNTDVDYYKVQLGEEDQISVFGLTYKFEELEAETAYEVKVIAVDIAGNMSNVVSNTTTTAEAPVSFPTPVLPTNVMVSDISQTEATVTWDDPAVEGLSFEVKVGDDIFETTELTYTLEGLTANTDYEVSVLSKNENDEKSSETELVSFKTLEEVAQEEKTLYVSTSGDDGQDGLSLETALATLNKAVELSNPKDKIIIDGTVSQTQVAAIVHELEIVGQNNATIDAGNTTKILTYSDVTEGTSLVIENVRFINANGDNNGVAEVGGAIQMSSVGELKLVNCSFENNTSAKPAGTLIIQNGVVNIYGTSFINNKADLQENSEGELVGSNAGAILVNSGANEVFLNVYESYFKGNSSTNHGGAITMEGTANNNNVYIKNSTISENSTVNAGGAIFIGNNVPGSLVLENVTLTKNETTNNSGNGAGIRVVSGVVTLQINNSILAHNLSSVGKAEEIYSDISLKPNPNISVNSSIISSVLEGDAYGTFTADDNVLFGKLSGSTLTDEPTLVINDINDDGVVTFAADALPVGFAKSDLATKADDHNLLVDQLGFVRAVKNGRIDCGAYQLDGKYDLATVLNDSEAPSAVANLSISESNVTSLTASWEAATDNLDIAFYELMLNDGTPTFADGSSTSYTFEDLTAETGYTVKVIAHDYAGNTSSAEEVSGETEEVPDDLPIPVVPTNVVVSTITQNSAVVTWDDPAVEGLSFRVLIGDDTYDADNNSVTIDGLSPNTEYTLTVVSLNAANELSESSDEVMFTTLEEQTGEEGDQKDIYVSSTGNNDNDGLTLENAVADLVTAYNLAVDGDRIIIDGTVNHNSYFAFVKRLEVIGQNNATLDASNSTKFFGYTDKNDGASLKLENITFVNGNSMIPGDGGAVGQLGGAILINSSGEVEINNCTFSNNTTTKGGGALAIQSGTVNIIGSTFVGNETVVDGDFSPNGGAILINSGAGDCNVNIYQTLIKDNVSVSHGGGIIIEGVTNNNKVFIQNSTLYNNVTTNAGGAIFIAGKDVGKLTVENSTLTKNYTLNNTGNAAGIRSVNLEYEVLVNNSIIYNNMSFYNSGNELMSDISFKVGVVAEINSSILGSVVESNNNAMFTGDGRTQYGTIVGSTLSNVPSLTLYDIDDRGVVGFDEDALPVGFAKVEFYTKDENSQYMADQLDNLRLSQEGRIDCGAYQLDGSINVSDLENDSQAPTDPANVTVTSVSTKSITLEWDISTDDVAVSHYLVSINDEEPISVLENEYTFTGLSELTTYTMTVQAVDYVDNKSEVITITQQTDGLKEPLLPTDIEVTEITASTAKVSWTVADTKGLTFVVSLQGEWFETEESSIELTGLDNDREYSVTVFSRNEDGETSEESEAVFFTTLAENVISSLDPSQIQFNAFPNPSTDLMTVKVGLSNYNVEVYDLSGRKVYTIDNVDQECTLQLKTGVYVLRILSKEYTLTKRVVFN
ncbi:fibronectin type III domain-containing protein [Flammeovirga agarivorans]|uniref:T9SS type A sorting domain-containing protein n=1 Tax=Flammeovirga agarivorans TaxID=2726742 RepID=A0A7X8SNQ7_9BACT|nr:fibronectin type III domain-containing protein [Flammeovirga agarivorans]NLR93502.1 T9SS type A sorting domain-containing protein [Flammeovirga agarivorans]